MATGKPLPKEKDKPKRAKLPQIKTVRTKCDNLLTPIIKKMYPRCLLCGNETEVAHHHVHKSKSTRLRYYIPNLINLCQKCHLRLHHNESYWASRIVEIKGIKWWREISNLNTNIVKADIHYYLWNYTVLKKKLESL